MVEVVRTIVDEGNVTDHDAPSAVDVDTPKCPNRKCSQPVAVECGVHPVFLGNVKDTIPCLNDAGGNHGYFHILYYARRLLWTTSRLSPGWRHQDAETSGNQRDGETTCKRHWCLGPLNSITVTAPSIIELDVAPE